LHALEAGREVEHQSCISAPSARCIARGADLQSSSAAAIARRYRESLDTVLLTPSLSRLNALEMSKQHHFFFAFGSFRYHRGRKITNA
jgi:hypothetical protein